MKKLIPVLVLALLLTACSTSPPETTLPPETAPVTLPPPPETTLPPETTVPTEPSVPETTQPEELHLGPDFQGMTLTQLQDWFYDFARAHCFHKMPDFSREQGPHKEASTYLYWVYAHDPADPEDEMMIVTREQLEQMVQTYFGITPGDHRGDPQSWSYDPETGIYSQYNGIMAYPDFYLFNSMEYIDGVYTIYATRYTSRLIPDNPEEDLLVKNALIQGDHKNLIATSDVVVSFRLNPETGEPFFLDYDEFRFIDGFPRP